ncbi:MAG: BMP family ABC transporter substrate-binding protein [Blastopirellula sp.]|nr:MAG: BMP family ABC transporter substrate-binding protein [Blastopirellula sp.]
MKPSLFFSRRQILKSSAAAASVAALAPHFALADGHMGPLDPDNMTIAFGHVGPKTDEGWTYTHHLGRQAVEKKYPNAKYLEVESIPFSAKGSRTFRQFAAQKADMAFITSDYGDLSNEIINANPNIAFHECAANDTGPNKRAYYVKHWDPSFLIGMAAGLLTKSNKLGYVGSYPTPAVQSSINSFHLGARSVKPAIETKAVYINSWFDPQGASQAGRALVGADCDFLFGIMDEAAYLQVAEEAGIWAAMWNTDIRKYGPKSYVSSVMLNWDDYYVSNVDKRVAGTWTGGELDLLSMGAGVDRDAWGQNVPAEIAAQVDEVRKKMLGGWTPFKGPMTDNEGNQKLAKGETLGEDVLYGWPWLLEGVTASS